MLQFHEVGTRCWKQEATSMRERGDTTVSGDHAESERFDDDDDDDDDAGNPAKKRLISSLTLLPHTPRAVLGPSSFTL